MNQATAQTIAAIQDDANRRIAAIQAAQAAADQIAEQNRLSEQQRAELAAQAETIEQSRANWAANQAPGFAEQLAALAKRAETLRKSYAQIQSLMDFCIDEQGAITGELSALADQIVASRAAMPDVVAGLVDLVAAADEAGATVADGIGFAVSAPQHMREAMRLRQGVGIIFALSSDRLQSDIRAAAADQARRRRQ